MSKHYRLVCDYDLQFLEELAEMIDGRLDGLDAEIDEEPDPDSMGLLDLPEYMYGVGLVACQLYVTEIIGKANKKAWLARGPKHRSGRFITEIVYAGGNYVKHNPEELGNAESIVILKALGLWRGDENRTGWVDYLAANLMGELLQPHPARFRTLLPWLIQWRDVVLEAEATET